MENTIDVLIIGAGPIGLACGIEAKKRSLSHKIIDKGVLVNSLYSYPSNMTFFSTAEKLEIGDVPFVSQNLKPTRAEAIEYYRRVAMQWELNIKLYESVENVKREYNSFTVQTNKEKYVAKNIVVATGFYDLPYKLKIKGESLAKVKHYYTDPHPYFGMNIVVVGAANSAVDAALEVYRKGAKSVTMVVRGKEINERVKYWVRPDILNRIEEGSIKAYFNSKISSIEDCTVSINTPEGEVTLKNDFVLALTGYQPNFDLLLKLGIEIQNDTFKTPVYNTDTMESNQKNIYLAGVVCGGLKTNRWFIENSRIHAVQILNAIKNN